MNYTPRLTSSKSIRLLNLPKDQKNQFQRKNTLESMVALQNSPRKIKLLEAVPPSGADPPISCRTRRTFTIRETPRLPSSLKPEAALMQLEIKTTKTPSKLEDRFELGEKISSNAYADIYYAVTKEDGSEVAVKIVKSESEATHKERLLLKKLAVSGHGILKDLSLIHI